MGSSRQPLGIGQQLEVAARAAVRARTHLDLWGATARYESRQRLLEPISEFWEPLRFLEHAQLVTYCMTICAIFDKRRGTLRLPELCRTLGRDVDLAPLLPRVAKVKVLRDNIFAHRNTSTTWEATFAEAAISPDIMQELAEGTLDLLNDMLKRQDLPMVLYHSLAREEYERLLKGGMTSAVRSIWNDLDDVV